MMYTRSSVDSDDWRDAVLRFKDPAARVTRRLVWEILGTFFCWALRLVSRGGWLSSGGSIRIPDGKKTRWGQREYQQLLFFYQEIIQIAVA